MQGWLAEATDYAVAAINAMALIVIAFGSVEAFITGVRTAMMPAAFPSSLRGGYLRYAHWLVAGLTFQMGADILQTAMTPTWDDIGRLVAIALIRTFLSYCLDHDIVELVGGAEPTSRKMKPPAS